MHVFDAHTHFFSRTFYEFQANQAPHLDTEQAFERLRRNGIDVPGPSVTQHRNRFIDDLDQNGVDRAVLFASVPDEMEVVGEACASSNDRLVPFATVNPLQPETLDRLEGLQPSYNFRGILLFPAMHDYGIGDEVTEDALNLAARHNMVVFVHCGLLRLRVRAILGLDPDFPLHRAHPEDLIPVALARPKQKFIVPHFSAGFFDELLRVGRRCPNVYVDTAGSNTWGLFQAPELHLDDMFEQAVEVFGVKRLLYGSDTASYPRGYRRDVLDNQIRAMHDAGLRAEHQERVLGGNLADILNL